MKIRTILFHIFLLFSSCSFCQSNYAPEIYDSTRTTDGYILCMCETKCTLMDHKGNILFNFPGNIVAFLNSKAEIAAHSYNHLLVYNKNLDVLLKVKTYIHHIITITAEDDFVFLTQEYHKVNNSSLRFDNILHLDSTGKELFRWSVFENRRYLLDFMMKDTSIFLYRAPYPSDPDSALFYLAPSLRRCGSAFRMINDSVIFKRKTRPFRAAINNKKIYEKSRRDSVKLDDNNLKDPINQQELIHLNSVKILPANESEKKDVVFKKGNILLCFNNFNDSIRSFLTIVDPVSFKILWFFVQKDGRGLHSPFMLPNGHILMYVNYRQKAPYSSVEEIDPLTKKVVWEYVENFPDTMLDDKMGSCQRLPNGNTFISNHNGYIYEITPEKEIVWKYNLYYAGLDEKINFYKAFLYSKEELDWLLNDE